MKKIITFICAIALFAAIADFSRFYKPDNEYLPQCDELYEVSLQ